MVGCWQGGSTFKSCELTKVIGRLQGCNWVNKCGRMLTRWIEIQLTRAPARPCWSRSGWKRRKWARSQNQTENWSSKENVVKSFWPTIMIAQHAPTSFGESGSWIQFDHIISWEGAQRGQNPQKSVLRALQIKPLLAKIKTEHHFRKFMAIGKLPWVFLPSKKFSRSF